MEVIAGRRGEFLSLETQAVRSELGRGGAGGGRGRGRNMPLMFFAAEWRIVFVLAWKYPLLCSVGWSRRLGISPLEATLVSKISERITGSCHR